MAINVFEGSRRIAWLITGVTVAITLIVLITNDPYVTANFTIANPNAPFLRSDAECASGSDREYFDVKTETGKEVSINLCILAMPFGEKQEMLVPYRVDANGTVWGMPSYSTEVSNYADGLERRFVLSPDDSKQLDSKYQQTYWRDLWSGLKYLAMSLVGFWALVWMIGWIVRGFLGIPIGKDRKD